MNKDNMKVIVWDLDETMGSFRRMGYETTNKNIPESERKVGLRKGIKGLLQKLSSEGFLHFINSSGTKDYVEEVLKRSGLSPYFAGFFGRDDNPHMGGKNYLPIAKQVGFSKEEAIEKMIVIGDAIGDRPADLDGLVFIEDPRCYRHDAILTEIILRKLLEKGNGNFNSGFKFLYENSTLKKSEIHPESNLLFRKYLINDIELSIGYEANSNFYNPENKVPSITVIDAKNYERELELI